MLKAMSIVMFNQMSSDRAQSSCNGQYSVDVRVRRRDISYRAQSRCNGQYSVDVRVRHRDISYRAAAMGSIA